MVRSQRGISVLAPAIMLLVMWVAPPATAQYMVTGGCVQDIASGAVCASNALSFVSNDLGVQNAGCILPGDTAEVILRVQISTDTANERYDMGLFFALDGGSALTPGTCARTIVNNPAAQGVTTCPPLDLEGGTGPYYNADGDGCGDILASYGPGCGRGVNIFDLPEAIQIPCEDADGNGFVEVSSCLTWGQNPNQVGPGGICSLPEHARPGNNPSCRCQTLTTRITVPNLDLSGVCDGGTVQPGEVVEVAVSYDNSASCSYDTSLPPRERCGTGSFLRYDTVDTWSDVGSSAAAGGSFAVEDDGGGTAAMASDTLEWNPNTDGIGDLPTIGGIIPPSSVAGASDTLVYRYTVPEVADGTIELTTTTMWFDRRCTNDTNRMCAADSDCAAGDTCDMSGTTPVAKDQSYTCTLNVVSPTWAAITGVRAVRDGGRGFVEWDTGAEIGTLGFEVERLDAGSGTWHPVSRELVPGVQVEAGGSYRLADPQAPVAGTVTYRIVEQELTGQRREHGPFVVAVEEGRRGALPEVLASRAHPPTARMMEALSASRRQAPARRTAKAPSGGPVKLVTVDAGLHVVTAEQVAGALGRPPGQASALIRGGGLQVSHGGEEVAWSPLPGGSGLVFFAEELDTPYTGENVYWLQAARGATMGVERNGRLAPASGAAFQDTVVFEENLLPQPALAQDPERDYWFWAVLLAGHGSLGSHAFPFELHEVAPGQGEVSLQLLGVSSPKRHRAEVVLNGVSLGEISWRRGGVVAHALPISGGLLRTGENQLQVVAREGLFLVDSFAVTHSRHYRAAGDRLTVRGDGNPVVSISGFTSPEIFVAALGEPGRPLRVEGATVDRAPDGSYRVSFRPTDASTPYEAVALGALGRPRLEAPALAGLRDRSRRGDYVIVTPDALQGAAEEWAAHRAADGLEPVVVTVGEVMDELRGGVFDPTAIGELLAWAWHHWALPPRYAVLFGGGSYDYRGYLGLGGDLVPPLMAAAHGGLVPADLAYGDVTGDGVPEIAVGRLPVLTAQEARQMLEKVVAYESSSAEPRGVLLAADNADRAGDFPADTLRLAGRMPDGVEASTVILGSPQTPEEVRHALLAALDGGSGLVSFIGHGGLDRFAHEGVLRTSDLAVLEGTSRPPLVTALTCNIGIFAIPGFSSLAEELVLRPGAGAVAVFSPAGLSFNHQSVALGEHLVPRLAAPQGARLGDLLLEGIGEYVAGGGDTTMLKVYVLMGDPALRLD